MNKEELLFYDAYEDFYKMAKESNAFKAFCKDYHGGRAEEEEYQGD